MFLFIKDKRSYPKFLSPLSDKTYFNAYGVNLNVLLCKTFFSLIISRVPNFILYIYTLDDMILVDKNVTHDNNDMYRAEEVS